jgi:hypothetical protein
MFEAKAKAAKFCPRGRGQSSRTPSLLTSSHHKFMQGTEIQIFHQSTASGLLKKFLKLMPELPILLNQPDSGIMLAIWIKVQLPRSNEHTEIAFKIPV